MHSHRIECALNIEERCNCVAPRCAVVFYIAENIEEAVPSSQVRLKTSLLMRKQVAYFEEPREATMHEGRSKSL